MGWAGIFQKYYFQGEVSPRWKGFLNKNVGVCPALSELSFNIVSMSDYFNTQFPLEPNFQNLTNESKKQRELLLSECDLRGLLERKDHTNHKNAWNRSYTSWEIYIKTPHLRPEPYRTITSWLPQVKNIPFIRRIAGFYLLSLNSNNSFEMYDSRSTNDF